MAELEPITPDEAKRMYLAQRENEVAEATLQSHHYRLKQLVQWCEREDISNLNNLSARALHRYRLSRKQEDELNQVTLQTQLSTVKVFLRFCESIDAVEEGLHEKIMLPTVEHGEDARDRMLQPDSAESLMAYLRRYEYASKRHALLLVLWHTACRIGGAHALDVEDFDEENESIAFRNRPKTGTRLKNGASGERMAALSSDVTSVLSDYIDVNRLDVSDEYGRRPLFPSQHGRMHKSNIRSIVYALTRPCHYTGNCPHGRDTNSCEAAQYDQASKCPSSRSPHDCRRGSITHLLKEDVPKEVVSDRANVSADVLDAHYNRMTEEEKMEQRREYLDNV